MFGRRRQTGSGNHGSSGEFGWPRSERARRRYRERADAELINELRWQWRSACSNTPLAPMIYTPSGAARAVPIIGQVDLGPPVSFTVRMRPGQTLADYRKAVPLIAPSMEVAALEVTPFVPHWVKIVLLPEPDVAMTVAR
jgi:hypothetical protein